MAKISISLAIHNKYSAFEDDEINDSDGLDLNRQTITSENDMLFKALIEVNKMRKIGRMLAMCSLFIASVAANLACMFWLYQDDTEELRRLRRF